MSNIKTGDILNYDYTGAVQTITLPKGKYKLECWGAQGGNGCTGNSYKGGTGGYSKGTLMLVKAETLYIYVGGQGVSAAASGSGNIREGGFNGGGSGRDWGSTSHGGSGGGGATDIRITSDSFYARVIVAGGGGGASDNGDGGAGGGTSGISTSSSCGTATGGSGFGQAAASSYTSGECGGGGGGWYGGYGGSSENYSGGGGSGYVYTASTVSNYPSGCLLDSSYYLTDFQTIAGNTSFTSPTGSSETGHSGNGYCRITVIEGSSDVALYGKLNGSIKKATGFYFKLNNKMYGIGNASAINGDVMNFDYTGSVQTATLTPGTYKLECWGAEGGASTYHSTLGGKGGYSSGIYTITQTTSLYIYVGGKGKTGSYAVDGGWNGGGGVTNSYNSGGSGDHLGTGGGATDISLVGGDCTKDQYYRYIRTQASYNSRIIVAGGGGGAEYSAGTAGGGIKGVNTDTTKEYAGTQTAAGVFYGNSTSSYVTMYAGGFGYGVSTTGGHTNHAMGACGGGGYYGGGAYGNNGNYSHGFGGSGYVSSSLTSTTLVNGEQTFMSPANVSETGHSGNGYVRITSLNPKNITYITSNQNAIMDFDYTGTVQSVTLKAGSYQLECWGAQGGYRSSSSYGGKGGYSTGTLTLASTTTLYIYVGGSGNSVKSATNSIYPGGFNGGGRRYNYKGGGGATDIRIGTDSLYARAIVAGGGGSDGATNKTGMYGGGTTGGSSSESYGSGGYGGTQTGNSWSTSKQSTSATSSSDCYAGFGFGGNGCYYSSGYAGAGGGGWYGGSGSYPDGSGDDDRGGGGGSGYVYTSSTASNYPSGCRLNSFYYLSDAKTIAGNTSFTSPTGSSETGHSGNGFCRITNLNPKQYGIYVKKNGTWTHIDL